MSQPVSTEAYRNAFDVHTGEGCSKKQSNALEQALDIRKFEIGLYWTRAAYFWTFIGISLAAFGGVHTLPEPQKGDFSVFVACIGFLSTFAWYCVNRGSKQWQENWENHVDLLEDDITGPLYKVVITRPPPLTYEERFRAHLTGPFPFSVSKINQIVSVYLLALWVFLLLYALPPIAGGTRAHAWYVLAILLTATAVCGIVLYGRTDPGVYKNIATQRESSLAEPVAKNA